MISVEDHSCCTLSDGKKRNNNIYLSVVQVDIAHDLSVRVVVFFTVLSGVRPSCVCELDKLLPGIRVCTGIFFSAVCNLSICPRGSIDYSTTTVSPVSTVCFVAAAERGSSSSSSSSSSSRAERVRCLSSHTVQQCHM